jgi:hypothetical protein
MIKQCKDFLIQKERRQLGLKFINRLLLVFAVIFYIYSDDIANYHSTVNEAWWRWKNILMVDFTLIVFALRSEIKSLVNEIGFKIIFYSLLNYFIDEYYGFKGWSWNDFLTISLILAESMCSVFVYKFETK